MNKITLTTPKGATLDLIEDHGSVRADVNGKPFAGTATYAGGETIDFGFAKAQIKSDDVAAVSSFFAASRDAKAAYIASYKLTNAEFAASIADKMSGKYSDY